MNIPNILNMNDGQTIALEKLTACLCLVLIILTACACMLLKFKVDAGFLWPIIAVICGFAGINSFDFSQFRKSDYGYLERKGEADAKVAAATITPPPVVTQPPAAAVQINS